MTNSVINQAKSNGFQGEPQRQATAPKRPAQTSVITKPVAIPALKALEHQLDTQAENLETQARALVQTKMGDAKLRVRDAVTDELAAIAGDDDFFGFGSMFDTVPILEASTDEPPAGEQTIETKVLAAVA